MCRRFESCRGHSGQPTVEPSPGGRRFPIGRRAFVEDHVFTTKLRGQPVGAPWDFSEWDSEDWPFTSAADDSPDELYAVWEGAVERSRTRLDSALADGGLDRPAASVGQPG